MAEHPSDNPAYLSQVKVYLKFLSELPLEELDKVITAAKFIDVGWAKMDWSLNLIKSRLKSKVGLGEGAVDRGFRYGFGVGLGIALGFSLPILLLLLLLRVLF